MNLDTQEIKEYYKYDAHGKRILFYVPNGACLWRAQTLNTKEPCTLEWINTFQPNDVLWDVGANVGVFSLYAAVMKGVKVFAFEPESANFKVLNENIRANKVQNNITAFCIAVANKHTFGKLYLNTIETGASGHQFDKIGTNNPPYGQGCVSFTLDMLQQQLGMPTHIKIDVDGIEPLVIEGGLDIVIPNVKTLLIELNERDKKRFLVKEMLIDRGFTWDADFANRSTHKSGRYIGVGEHLFTR